MKREQFEEILKAEGWELDRFGHYQKTNHWEHKYRVKMQAQSCRIADREALNLEEDENFGDC